MADSITEHKQARRRGKLHGFVDGIHRTGFIEGWAFDELRPWTPIDVRIRADGLWLAEGCAQNFRQDLMLAGAGTGWCGFLLATSAAPEELCHSTLYVVERSGAVILKSEKPPLWEEDTNELRAVEQVINTDPTMVWSVQQLRGCDRIFAEFIRRRGVDAFVRTAYTYVLGRPADEEGLNLYANRIRRGLHQPFDLLEVLAQSPEYTERRPAMIAPTRPSFPFLTD